MNRLLAALAIIFLATQASAQELRPLPSDLSKLPTLGVSKTEAMKILDRNMQFVGMQEKNGLVRMAATPDGKINVIFKCAKDYVIAASITVPMTGAEPSAQDALKHAVLLRFLVNLVPEVDWQQPGKNPFGKVIKDLSQSAEENWTTTIGEKRISATRARPGFVVIRVINVQTVQERYNIGKF